MTREDKELLLKDLSARLPYGIKGNEIVEVRARYFNNVEVLIKHYTSSDAAYNRLCAEELVKKLNERV